MAKKNVKRTSPATGDVLGGLAQAARSAAQAELERLRALRAQSAKPADCDETLGVLEGLGQDELELVLGWRSDVRRKAQSLRDRLAGERPLREAERAEVAEISSAIDRAQRMGVAGDDPAMAVAQRKLGEVRGRKFARARAIARVAQELDELLAGIPFGGASALGREAAEEAVSLARKGQALLAGLTGRRGAKEGKTLVFSSGPAPEVTVMEAAFKAAS